MVFDKKQSSVSLTLAVLILPAFLGYSILHAVYISASDTYQKTSATITRAVRDVGRSSFFNLTLEYDFDFQHQGQRYSGHGESYMGRNKYHPGSSVEVFFKRSNPSNNGLVFELYETICYALGATLLIVPLYFKRPKEL